MLITLLSVSWLLASSTAAKKCQNISVPVTLSARNGVFNLPILETNLDATTFVQKLNNIGGNFSNEVLTGYQTIDNTYDISAKFCSPDTDEGSNPTVQFLTHGVGFDKSYWDLPFDNFNYSYIDVAVDQFGFSTLAIDRLGTGNSSIADPLNIIQAPAEASAIYELTSMLRAGKLPNVAQAFEKVVHVGHSFGSFLTYDLAALDPSFSDGLILTGFSLDFAYLSATFAAWDSKLARLNQPLRFGDVSYSALASVIGETNSDLTTSLAGLGLSAAEYESVVQSTDLADFMAGIQPSTYPHEANLPSGYLTWSDASCLQYFALSPGFFDPAVLQFGELFKQPYTLGELLTLGGLPLSVPGFTGPVMVLTGDQDAAFCGGDCLSTAPSIPAGVEAAFPAAKVFETYIQPNTGHAINLHYNATGAYVVMQEFLIAQGLGSD